VQNLTLIKYPVRSETVIYKYQSLLPDYPTDGNSEILKLPIIIGKFPDELLLETKTIDNFHELVSISNSPEIFRRKGNCLCFRFNDISPGFAVTGCQTDL